MAEGPTTRNSNGYLPDEVRMVRDVISSFSSAAKSHSLYPENHSICLKSLSKVESSLGAYYDRYPSLRLDVKKESIFYGTEAVHQGPASPENWAFILFRDGIERIEFQPGLKTEEIRAFLKILANCRTMREDTEEDLVTALWEAELPHLRYRAVELNWEMEPLDLSLPATDTDRPAADEEGEEGQTERTTPVDAAQTAEGFYAALTPSEEKKIQEMVFEEENRDTAQDLLDVVLAVLDDQDDESVLAEVLAFLKEEFRDILLQGDFPFARGFLSSLRQVQRRYETEKAWATPLLEEFFTDASSPTVLEALSGHWATMDILDGDRMKLVRQTLLLLKPQAVLALGPMLPQIRSSSIQRQLMEVIAILAQRDMGPLEQLLESPEEAVVQRLLFVVGQMKGEKADAILKRMIRHPSEKVRRQALKSLLAKDPQAATWFFHLIEDPGDSIRRMIFDSLGKRRDESAENLLLDYLKQGRFRLTDPQHLAACFRTLGRCGSSRSVSFLKGVLFERGWIPDFSKSVQREGAVTALALLDNEASRTLLQKASKSLLPSVRRACRKASRKANEQPHASDG